MITTPLGVHAFTLNGPVFRSDAWLVREFRPKCPPPQPPLLYEPPAPPAQLDFDAAT